MSEQYTCEGCSRELKKGRRYCLKMQIFAAPEVVLEREDLAKDLQEEVRCLNEAAQAMDAKDLEEQVYICYDLSLCRRCRDAFVKRIKLKEFI